MARAHCGMLCTSQKNEVGLYTLVRKDSGDIASSLHPLTACPEYYVTRGKKV